MSCLLCRVFHIALSLKHSEWKPFLTGWLHSADKPAGIKNGSGSSTSGISVVFRKQTCCPGALSDLFVQFMLLVIYQQKKLPIPMEVAVLLFSWLDSSWTSLNASKTHRLIKEHWCWGTSGCTAAQILIFTGTDMLLRATENKTSKITLRPSSSLSLSPSFQLLSAHTRSLMQKTENSNRNQQTFSSANASSNPSGLELRPLGKILPRNHTMR